MSVEREAITALKWSGGAKLTGQLVNWAITLVVVRLLAPEDYGLMAITTAVTAVLAIAAELGLGSSLVQTREVNDQALARVAGLVVTLNLSMAVVLALGAPLIALLMHEPKLTAVVQVSALQFVFAAISAVPQALLTRDLVFKRLATVELAAGVITNASMLLLAWHGAGVWSLVLGTQIGGAVRAISLVAAGGWVRPRFDFIGMRSHLRFGGALTLSRLMWQVASQVDVFVAARYLGSGALGVYSVAITLASMPMQKIMSVVNQVAFPAVARIQGETVRLRANLLRASRLICFVGVPAAWGLASVAHEFTLLIFGEDWLAVALPLRILCALIPARMLGALFVTAAVGRGSAGTEVRNTLVSFIVLPPAFLIGVRWGVAGLAWAWVAGMLLVYLIVMPRIGRILEIRLREVLAAIAPAVMAGFAMVVVVLTVRAMVSLPKPAAELALLVLSGALTYLTTIWRLDRRIWDDCRKLLAR